MPRLLVLMALRFMVPMDICLTNSYKMELTKEQTVMGALLKIVRDLCWRSRMLFYLYGQLDVLGCI